MTYLWKIEKQQTWMQWIETLNVLDHKKATSEFYSEIKRKKARNEEICPIVNEKGKLSTTLNERMQNWRNYYEKIYSQSQV